MNIGIVGLGYVGLPLAVAFAEAGSGYELNRIAASAAPSDGCYVLSGRKIAVLNR